MSDDTKGPTESRNETIINEFRAHGGVVGGNFAGAPILILHTRGAKTALPREHPMMYLNYEDQLYVFASKAGADSDPDWYRNLVANPEVSIELGTDTLSVTAVPLEGEERTRIYAVQAERYPGFAGYQVKTSRVIPVVKLVPAS